MEESSLHHSGSIPSYWERLHNYSGITYEDPSLVSTQVGGTAHRTHQLASGQVREKSNPPRAKPISWQGWDYGFQEVERPESLKILSHGDFRPISHVGMFSPILHTQHPGWFLDVKK